LKKNNIFNKFPSTFWIANTAELIERLAWYGFYMVFAIYLTASKETGALGFSQVEKSYIMSLGTTLLYLLPIITGSIADKFGYKKILLLSFAIYSSGFLLLGKATNFSSVFAIFIYIAIGGAFFKPIISATIAKTTNEKNSSIGFGIFYLMVNIGSFIGPLFTSNLRQSSWYSVFLFTSAVFILNFILILFFYKEPERIKNNKTFKSSISESFINIFKVLKDLKFVIFLILIAGFWAMYYQLFYSLPVFIEQWVDTSILFNKINSISPYIANLIGTSQHTIAAEMITNIDAMYIIVFQIIISAIVMKFKPLNAMISGILIASIGMGLMFFSMNPVFLLFAILIFSLGEMSSSPKITEYIGRIAPKDRVAMYMGTSFLPVALGSSIAGYLSGSVYQNIADKISIIYKDGLARGINLQKINNNFTQTDLINEYLQKTNQTLNQMNNYLWSEYQPYNILYVYASIGFITTLGLLAYHKFANK